MPEFFLHYIWQRRIFLQLPQFTTDGRRVDVLDTGRRNTDAGPDFFSSIVCIDGVVWTGNVEIHVNSSDWYRHGHNTDPAYDNVVLHVVRKADKPVFNSRGEPVPQCELQYPYEPVFLDRMLSDNEALCGFRLQNNPSVMTAGWLSCLTVERLKRKTGAINVLLSLSHNNWEEAFYITLAHNFGFHTNGLPFEMLAKHTPLSFLLKHRNSLFQLEAMLLGQSGLLNENTAVDDYSRRLLKEYLFLQKKFALTPLQPGMWKMMRMRPQSFPHMRIAQFAALIHHREMLLQACLETDSLTGLRNLLQVEVSEYWRSHYRFADSAAKGSGCMGKAAADVLVINTVVPYKYAWGVAHNDSGLINKALQLLDDMPAENNNIIRQWRQLGVVPANAAQSQALLQLHQEYCIRKRCADCNVGYQIFTPQNNE